MEHKWKIIAYNDSTTNGLVIIAICDRHEEEHEFCSARLTEQQIEDILNKETNEEQ